MKPVVIRTAKGKVEVATAGAGRPVLVVHGSPGGYDQGLALGQFLVDAEYRVIAPSRPGYLGTPLESGASIDEQADLLAALLDELGVKRLPVVCWSGGAPSSYRLAVRHPGRVRALIIFSGVSKAYTMHSESFFENLLLSSGWGNWLIRQMADHAPKMTIESTLKAEGDLSKGDLKEIVTKVFADKKQREFVQQLAQTVSYRPDRRVGFENDRDQYASIKSLKLEKIETPTLIVHGEVDTDVPYDQGEFASGAIKDAKFISVPKGTHICAYASAEAGQIQKAALNLLSGADRTTR